jgi:hypothetical protein
MLAESLDEGAMSSALRAGRLYPLLITVTR